VNLALFLGASVGHIAILSASLNRWYGHALPRRFLLAIRGLHGVLVLAGLAAFAWIWPFQGIRFELNDSTPGWQTALVGYMVSCSAVGLIWVPLLSFERWLRGRPAVLCSNHTHTVDVAKELGYLPVGRGKHHRVARWPGNQVFRVDLAERTLVLPRLPAAWDGLTILHVSDLHFCGTPDRAFYQYVMDGCREWDPDLVALTGDIVDGDEYHRWIVPVLGRLHWRTAAFAVLGNHDTWHDPQRIRRRLGRAGLRVLDNAWELIEVRGQQLVVIGHEGPWFRPGPDLTDCPTEPFRLCLSHTPDNLPWAKRHQIDLMLAGHNHGGQIRFPFIGSVLVPSRYGRRYDCGTFHEPPTVLHVSRGLGGKQPLRYNCRPEVTKIVLRRPSV
jgi:predicted MPP superfamily phosphohydrolase